MDRRARQRAATAAEIRDTARRQLSATGAAALSLRAVAREMGLSAPALYRYYDDRDALLSALIVDAYRGLNDRLEQARDAQPVDDATARMLAACLAYRAWGISAPHEFALVFGSPVPGYDAPDDGPSAQEGARFGVIFLDLFTAVGVEDTASMPPGGLRTPVLDKALVAAAQSCGHALSPGAMQLFVSAWGRLHGMVSLEVFGHIGWLELADPASLYHAEMLDLVARCGRRGDLALLRDVEARTSAAAAAA